MKSYESIKKSFESFIEIVYKGIEMGEQQKKEMELLFFSGAQFMFDSLTIPTEDGRRVEFFEDLKTELDVYRDTKLGEIGNVN